MIDPPALRVAAASFAREGRTLVAAFDLLVARGERMTLAQPSARAASIAASMCAALVKPSSGAVYVGDYETRLQPAQAKRLVAFVPADVEAYAHDFPRALALRAALLEVPDELAARRARDVEALLGHGTYARAVALALCNEAALIVLDQPPPDVARAVAALRPFAALLSTSVAPARERRSDPAPLEART